MPDVSRASAASGTKSLCFVATTPFAVNAFLLGHMASLSDIFRVTLCVNLDLYPLSPKIDARVRVIPIPIARKISPVDDLRALFALIRIMHRERFDAVHSITPKGGLIAMLSAFMCRVPHRFHTFTGQVWATRKGLARIALKAMDRLIVAFSTRVFCDSHSQSRFLTSEGLGEVEVLGGGAIVGVNLDRFKPDGEARQRLRRDLGVPEGGFVFLYVGRLAREKGVFDLVYAFSGLAGKREDVALWLVGPDEESLRAELERLAGRAGDKVRWLGPRPEPEHYMAAADLLVLPSYREGFGMVIIEAAGCGVPSLAYRIDGVVDALVEGETGILVAARDVVALEAAMAEAVDKREWLGQLGQAAQARVKRAFSAAAVTQAWLDFYRRIA